MQLYNRADIDIAYGQALILRNAARQEGGNPEWAGRLDLIVGVLAQYRNLLDGIPLEGPSPKNKHIDDIVWGQADALDD